MKAKQGVFIALAVAALGFWWWSGPGETGADKRQSAMHQGPGGGAASHTVPVKTHMIKLVSGDRVFEAVGTARARLSADLYPAVAGEVAEVLFEAGQQVKAGEVLLRLDDRKEKVAVELAQVRLKDARTLLGRYEKAGGEGAVPQSEVDAARTGVEAAELALKQARLNLEDRHVRAPFDGVVGIARVDPGDRVDGGTLVTGLDARERLYVDFEVPEALAGALAKAQQEKQSVTAETPAWPGRLFAGEIAARESRVDRDRRTMRVRAEFANEEDLLRPGMSFTVRWEIPGATHPAVPEIALQWSREGSFVWAIKGDKAEKVMAPVASRRAGMVLLESGVEEGDQVVVEGLQRLRPGALVKILGAQAK